MIVAIDGPAGAGKSSVSRQLANRLGFQFLDTGAMYRAVALLALRKGLTAADSEEIAQLARHMQLRFISGRVILDGADITAQIRTSEVASRVHLAADNPAVREFLVQKQREIGELADTVTEGRDQGTVAFPQAECKIFLTATREERARRRHAELLQRGEHFTFEEVLEQNDERDYRDSTRPIGRLIKADDAIEFYTDGLTSDEVVNKLEAIVLSRQAEADLSAKPSL